MDVLTNNFIILLEQHINVFNEVDQNLDTFNKICNQDTHCLPILLLPGLDPKANHFLLFVFAAKIPKRETVNFFPTLYTFSIYT